MSYRSSLKKSPWEIHIGKHPFKVYTASNLDQLPQFTSLPEEQRREMRIVASVLPFRVNEYVANELIDWKAPWNDPIFRLTFPQREMLSDDHFRRMERLFDGGADGKRIREEAHDIRLALNPHPAGQLELNVPRDDRGAPINGIQHKYRETVLFFPSQGQTCHSYCTFCFRWAQFIGDKELHIASREADQLHAYLRAHTEITDLLITGGDPMIMKTRHLERFLAPLLDPRFDHIQTIRIGTKALTFWPYRFVTDEDAGALLALLARLVEAGKHVAVMAHYNHWRELTTGIAEEAIRRVRAAGVVIRSQGPLLAHINDDPAIWSELWRRQVSLGIVPYYMFVMRDTGAQCYFEVPLGRAWKIYREAIQKVSGLGRTARGPSMSAGPGKVEVQGVTEVKGEKVLVLRFIQGRNPDWVQRPFFARYNESATWLSDLRPAFGHKEFFFEEEYRSIKRGIQRRS